MSEHFCPLTFLVTENDHGRMIPSECQLAAPLPGCTDRNMSYSCRVSVGERPNADFEDLSTTVQEDRRRTGKEDRINGEEMGEEVEGSCFKST